MSNEGRPSHEQNEQAARKTLEVTVSAQAGARKPVDPESITLNNSVLRVVWRGVNLPSDASLQIVFRGDARGPFLLLESTGSEVIGWGNRGPAETETQYNYEAAVQTGTGTEGIGPGTIKNRTTKPIMVPTTTYPPPGPPDKEET
jgi:hypothetical protein